MAELLGLLAIWELLARFTWVGGSVPPPTSALAHIVSHRDEYLPHAQATLGVAAAGLVLGCAIGVACALLFSFSNLAQTSLRGLILAAYTAPPVVLLPVLAALFSTITTRLTVITSMIAYPMTVSMLVGLQSVDPRSVELVHASGGGAFQVLWRLRLPHSLPNFLSGLQIAIPGALLGAMLAELAGGRWGLGLYLISGLKNGDMPLVWGVTMIATAISAAGYLGCGALEKRVRTGRHQAETTESGILAAARDGGRVTTTRTRARAAAAAALGLVVPFAVWWAAVRVLHRSPIVVKDPLGVWEQLATGPRAAENRSQIGSALGSTLGNTAAGFVAGLSVALVLAVVFETRPRLKTLLLPGALLSQTVPLIALVPILIIAFGRGLTTLVLIGISITFFPSFIIIGQGLSQVSPSLVDLVRASGGSPLAVLWKVKLPNALPYVTAAARLLAPRALLGVILAEYVATGGGLGFLVYRARGSLDYGMMWAAAVVAVLLSGLAFWVTGRIEQVVSRRFAGAR